jgi:hypothetical protein
MFPEGKEALNGSASLKAYFDTHAKRPSFASTSPIAA